MEEADGGFSEDRVADRGDAPSSSSSGRPVESEQVRELSILDALRAPRLSELTRKRKVVCNPPPIGQRRSRGSGASEPKTVSPLDRVKEFPNECLTVTGKKLFCNACREELSLRKNIVTNHIASSKHKQGKEKLQHKEARERDIAKCLKAYDEINHPAGETLPMEQRVYRLKVFKTFLRAAVPLTKLDAFRDLLEENMFRLTDRRHMCDMVPHIVTQEKADIKAEIQGKPVSVIFDG